MSLSVGDFSVSSFSKRTNYTTPALEKGKKEQFGIDVGAKHSNNYPSCYGLTIVGNKGFTNPPFRILLEKGVMGIYPPIYITGKINISK